MNIVFSGLDAPVKVTPGFTTTLQIENEMLFSRIVRSLSYPDGHFALEPFTLWEDNNELRPSAALMFVSDVLVLPWDDRSLMGEVTKRFERWFLEDEDLRREVEEFDAVLSSKLLEMGFGMNSDFQFALEWDLKKYLKFRGFGVGIQDDAVLLDNIIDFLSLALDAGCKKTIVFVNLKTFLTKNDLKTFFEHVFYSKLSVLLLENKQDNVEHDYEQKTVVDQLFLES
jgi:CRISPR-associated protein Csn2